MQQAFKTLAYTSGQVVVSWGFAGNIPTKFWEVKCKEWILLWRRRVKKKCWMEIRKRVDIPTNLENTSYYLPSPIFISFPFAFTLHYVLIKSLFDLEDCVV